MNSKKALSVFLGIAAIAVVIPLARRDAKAQTAVRSTLLFGFVTARVGLDTGLALTNTSLTPFSAGTPGICEVDYYGSTLNERRFTLRRTVSIAAGEQITWNVSAGSVQVPPVPGFQGYIVASCDVAAEGIAAISDVNFSRFLSVVPATQLSRAQ